jgi:hypothetical protein
MNFLGLGKFITPQYDWSDCVGRPLEDAEEIIHSDMPKAKIEVSHPGDPMICDKRSDRVVLCVNKDNIVTNNPHIA